MAAHAGIGGFIHAAVEHGIAVGVGVVVDVLLPLGGGVAAAQGVVGTGADAAGLGGGADISGSAEIGQAIHLLEAYNISSLPRCFVLDTNGTIVLKTDNGIELKQSLETLGVIPKDEK